MQTPPLEGHEDRLTCLMHRLPAELRLEIYDLCLGLTHRTIFAQRPRTGGDYRWMMTSRVIFAEAAPLLYDHTTLRFHLGPDPNDVPSLASHVEEHFSSDPNYAEKTIRSSLANIVMVVLPESSDSSLHPFLDWNVTTSYLKDFAKLEKLEIRFRHLVEPEEAKDAKKLLSWRDADDRKLTKKIRPPNRASNHSLESRELRNICLNMRRIANILPKGCEVQWSREHRFLRVSLKHSIEIGHTFDRIWRFVTSKLGYELNQLLGQ